MMSIRKDAKESCLVDTRSLSSLWHHELWDMAGELQWWGIGSIFLHRFCSNLQLWHQKFSVWPIILELFNSLNSILLSLHFSIWRRSTIMSLCDTELCFSFPPGSGNIKQLPLSSLKKVMKQMKISKLKMNHNKMEILQTRDSQAQESWKWYLLEYHPLGTRETQMPFVARNDQCSNNLLVGLWQCTLHG